MKILGMGLPELIFLSPIFATIIIVFIASRVRKNENNRVEKKASRSCKNSITGNYPPPFQESIHFPSPQEHHHQQSQQETANIIACQSCGSAVSAWQSTCNWCGKTLIRENTPPRNWKTSVGFSLLGVLVGFPLFALATALVGLIVAFEFGLVLGFLTGANVTEFLVMPFTVIIGIFLQIIYAAKIYPSYFSEKPVLKSSKIISFLNFMVGSVIFGCLWNRNLARKTKGFSHIVYIIVSLLSVAYFVFSLGMVILSGLMYVPEAPQSNSSSNITQPTVSNEEQLSREESEGAKAANYYIDTETGVRFVIPDTWHEVPFSVSSQGRKAKFRVPDGGTAFYSSGKMRKISTENSEDDAIKNYGGMDAWSEEDVLAFLKDSAPSTIVKRITLNDVEYFEIVDRPPSENYLNVSVMRIENGYYYGFQYTELYGESMGYDRNKVLEDFYAMVESTVCELGAE